MANLIPNNVLFSTISNSLSDFMIGAVQAFATNNPGTGWITCDGQEVKRSEYPKLFSKIGNSYGTPSNDTYFKIPAINNNGYFIRGGFNIASVQGDAIRNERRTPSQKSIIESLMLLNGVTSPVNQT